MCCRVRRTSPTRCKRSSSSSRRGARWRSFWASWKAEGFLADRLEAPGLDQLLAVNIREEGVWIVPGAEGESALVAWWYGGTVQHLALHALGTGPERGAQLKKQIEQIAWAGELEGWLPGSPKIHLVAGKEEARFWEPVFREAGEEIHLVAPAPEAQLAASSAQRCARDSGAPTWCRAILPSAITSNSWTGFGCADCRRCSGRMSWG